MDVVFVVRVVVGALVCVLVGGALVGALEGTLVDGALVGTLMEALAGVVFAHLISEQYISPTSMCGEGTPTNSEA